MNQPFEIEFANGQTANTIHVRNFKELPAAVTAIGLKSLRPTSVLVGGAGDMEAFEMSRLRPLFVETLAPLAEALTLAVIDGGTDAGVMQLMGQARREIKASFPLIGVAAMGTVKLPKTNTSAESPKADLEPNHSHFMLVPGGNWGDESPWMSQAATVISGDAYSITLLVNGGDFTRKDVTRSLEVKRPVVVLRGTGRYADEFAQSYFANDLVQVVDVGDGSQKIQSAIKFYFTE